MSTDVLSIVSKSYAIPTNNGDDESRRLREHLSTSGNKSFPLFEPVSPDEPRKRPTTRFKLGKPNDQQWCGKLLPPAETGAEPGGPLTRPTPEEELGHLDEIPRRWYRQNRNVVNDIGGPGPCVLIHVMYATCDIPFQLYALMDTGAQINYIPQMMVDTLGIPSYKITIPRPTTVADGTTHLVTHFADLTVVLKGQEYKTSFAVFPCNEMILGLYFQRQYQWHVVPATSTLTFLGMENPKIFMEILSGRHTLWKQYQNSFSTNKFIRDESTMSWLEWNDYLEQERKNSSGCQQGGEVEFLVRKSCTIPPMTEKVVEVISTTKDSHTVMVTNPRMNNVGTVVKTQLHFANSSFILLTNFNKFPIHVKQGSLVAEGHLLKTVQHLMVKSSGTKVLAVEEAGTEDVDPNLMVNEQENYFSHFYQSLVVKDTFRMIAKNKTPCNYPSRYDPTNVVCQKLMKQELGDRVPEFVTGGKEVHINRRKDVRYAQFDFNCFNIGKEDMKEEYIEGLKKIIFEFRSAFVHSKGDIGNIDRSKLPKVKIKLNTNVPVTSHPYRRSPKDRQIIEDIIQEMLEAGIIRPSESPYSSPVVIVGKKDGGQRMCVDYRKLNAITVKDEYPLPLISDALDTCAGSSWFSSLDLFCGYHLLPMDEDSIAKTAFISHCGLFEYVVLPFGLTSAPAKLQRLMDRVLGSLKWSSCFIYLDDVIIFAKTFEEHQERLRKVLLAFDSVGLKLNPKKCMFGFRELEYLGHVISKKGIRPSKAKTEKIANMKPPKNLKQLRMFLGLVGYFRSFDAPHIFKTAQYEAFEKLKNALIQKPVRTFFDDKAVHEVHTDASGKGLGAVLFQQEIDGNKTVVKVVQYWSRGLKPAEQNYEATELEMLAVVEALEAFRPYLHGLHFTIVTDHIALKALEGGELCSKSRANRRLAKWKLLISDFDYEIRYKKGSTHHVPDALSRYDPMEEDGKEPDDERMFFSSVKEEKNEKQVQIKSIKELQETDPFCLHIKSLLEKGAEERKKSLNKKFLVQEGILYRKWLPDRRHGLCVVANLSAWK